MGSFYRLQIQCDLKKLERLELILRQSNDSSNVGWSLIVEENSPKFTSALHIFIELISANLQRLKEIGVSMDKVSFWYMYEYEHQCNMEFLPEVTRRIGELGIVLCISCWEK